MTVVVQQHFDRQAAAWEKKLAPDGSMADRPLLFVDLLREFALPHGSILDFGCGTGDITIACRSAGFDPRGADTSRSMIDRARQRYASADLRFDLLPDTDSAVLPFADAAFDAVIASSVLEYVAAPETTLSELYRVCRGGAVLIATVPDMRYPGRWIERAARPLLAWGGHFRSARLNLYCEYLRISRNRFSAARWRRTLACAGWTVRTVRRGRHPLMIVVATR